MVIACAPIDIGDTQLVYNVSIMRRKYVLLHPKLRLVLSNRFMLLLFICGQRCDQFVAMSLSITRACRNHNHAQL